MQQTPDGLLPKPLLTFVKDGQRRWERLVAEVDASGEATRQQLEEPTTASLRTVWTWMLPRLRKRPSGEPLDPSLQPPWWQGPTWGTYAGWDDATIDRAGAVAYQLARVLASRPGATWQIGPPGSADEGEALVLRPGRCDNPLRAVLVALADAWDGQGEPDALVRFVEQDPDALPPDLLFPTRLVLRLRGTPSGLRRRRNDLDLPSVSSFLGGLLGSPLDLPRAGATTFEYIGSGDWRALIDVVTSPGGVQQLRAVIGASYEGPPDQARPEQVRGFVNALVRMAAGTGGAVEIVDAQPDPMDARRPTGLLTPDRVEEVLAAVAL